jgi:outer membrane lipoprotein SlyB
MSVALLGASLAISLAACSTTEPRVASTPYPDAPYPTTPNPNTGYNNGYASTCDDCGTISYIQQVNGAPAKGSGLGMVLGAVAGGLLGHQVGDGKGQTAATVGGAVVGGYAGNEVEKRAKGSGEADYYRVTVDMDYGRGTRTIDVSTMNGLSNGSRVKFVGGNLQALG